jgi:hypothetical protein
MTLPRYHLTARDDGTWALMRQGADRATRIFPSKADATAGGALEGALGDEGGTVRIHLRTGEFEEERTFPRSADPAASPG